MNSRYTHKKKKLKKSLIRLKGESEGQNINGTIKTVHCEKYGRLLTAKLLCRDFTGEILNLQNLLQFYKIRYQESK